MSWNRKHLLDIESLTAEEIFTVLDTARAFKAVGGLHQLLKSRGLGMRQWSRDLFIPRSRR